MFEKIEILIIVFILLLTFYLVITLAAGEKRKGHLPPEIKNYLFGVRILIIIIGVVATILWFFL